MKNLALVINAALALAIIVLFWLVLGKKNCDTSTKNTFTKNTSTHGKLPIAYINVDSLLSNYQFAKDANELLTRKQEDSRMLINSRAKELQNEMNEFQKKLENNAFLSRERAENERARIQKKQEDLQHLEGKLSQQLLQVQQKMSEELRDTINKFIKEYNKSKKYEVIISNTSSDNILYADKSYNITGDVTRILNERCAKK